VGFSRAGIADEANVEALVDPFAPGQLQKFLLVEVLTPPI
jgi:hypothetical protein